jgi:alpha-galactosidase
VAVVVFALVAMSAPAAASVNRTVAQLAPTPPMGWSSWYGFGCAINDALFERTANAIVRSGMAAAGYRYVNVDDCWMARKRNAAGALQPNPVEFPEGISGLASYVHGLRLKLGIYLDAGSATCTGFPGSAGHYGQDARTIATWGIDAVKVDYCRARPAAAQPIYKRIQQALAATHRPITLNVCEWGYQDPWLWAPQIANSWRISGDYFSYGAPHNYWKALLRVVDFNAGLAGYSRPGAYNDPNQLLIGTGVLKVSEERAQLSLWSMMAAPLIAGGELSKISRATLQVLTNREVIAIDQDPAGLQGTRTTDDSAHQVWVRQLKDGSEALLVLNTSSRAAAYKLDVSHIGLPAASSYVVRDLWQHRSSRTSGPMLVTVASHDVRMLRVQP